MILVLIVRVRGESHKSPQSGLEASSIRAIPAMIVCIFTIDYEIYGNGEGSLRELVYEPTRRLVEIFRKWDAPFVAFVEVAELEIIESKGADHAIDLVKQQVREMDAMGIELGLHLHPQWYNADYEAGKWNLDYREYNLCTLPPARIAEIVQRSVDYFRKILGKPDWTPLAFRAGNWLLQPTSAVTEVLAATGIKIDSSVFKGGRQRNIGLDYRPARKNGYFWRFSEDVNLADPRGLLLELPTYTEMVPSWKMATGKRLGMKRVGAGGSRVRSRRLGRYLDLFRLRYPLKMDFCRMTAGELSSMMNKVIREDQKAPNVLRPIVAIGHTKDLADYATVERFLGYLNGKGINISTFQDVYQACIIENENT